MIYKNRFEDFFFETTASTLDYMISTGGQVIFQGRAVKSPANPVLRVNVGKRVRDYLENEMPDFRDYDGVVVPHPDALLDFELQDVFGNPLETYRVLLDYTEDFTGADMILSDPVNGHTDPRQKIFWDSFNTTERDITIEIARNLELYLDVDIPYWIPNSGGTFNIHYTANTDFTFSYTGDWFTAVLSGDTIVITATENETEYERSGSICFTYFGTDFKERTKCYEIRQEEPFEVVFDVDVPIIVPYGLDTYDIHYTANTPVEITVESDWFTASTDNGVIHIIVDGDADSSEAGTICFHYLGGVECYEVESRDIPEKYLTFDILTGGTLVWHDTYTGSTVQYSLDNGATWYDLPKVSSSGTPLSVSEGQTVIFRGDYNDSNRGVGGSFFGSTAFYNVSGQLSSISGFRCSVYPSLFGSTNVVSAYELKVPAALPKESGYCGLFEWCGRLITAPSVLPALHLNKHCYVNMFKGCYSLVNPPVLPATNLAIECYESMFEDCKSLVNSPVLPATNLAMECYEKMFYGCNKLSSIKCLAENSYWGATASWVYGVSANGTFTKKSGFSLNTGVNGIPNGWTVVNV